MTKLTRRGRKMTSNVSMIPGETKALLKKQFGSVQRLQEILEEVIELAGEDADMINADGIADTVRLEIECLSDGSLVHNVFISAEVK